MADYAALLLTKAFTTGKLNDVAARGIEPEHFADEFDREIYEWGLEFMRRFKSPPSMSAVKDEFPGFRPKLDSNPLEYHVERFIEHVREIAATELVRDYHQRMKEPDSLKQIEVYALDMAQQLAEIVPVPRASRLSEGTARKEEYYRRKKEGIQHGINIGIPTFDELMVGVQPHELVVWGGPPGGGKTTGMIFQGLNAYLQGETVLFISLEVEAEQIIRRFDVMLSKVRSRALKALELNTDELRAWEEVLEQCEKDRMHRDIIIRDDIKNCSVERVGAEQMRYKPGMVIVDYLEEMSTPRGIAGWEAVRENGRGLKQSARVTKTPHVTGTQLNREGETAYQSAQKIADALIVIDPPEEDDEEQDIVTLTLRKYRDGPSRRQVRMVWDMETGRVHEEGAAERLARPKARPLGASNGHKPKGALGKVLKEQSPTTPRKGSIAKARAKR